TTLQRDIPAQVYARVRSYDILVSFVFMPLGFVFFPLIARAAGSGPTLLAAACVVAVTNRVVAPVPGVLEVTDSAQPSVRGRVRRHPVGDRLDRRLGIDRDDADLDHVGHVRADHDEAEQLSVLGLVDGLDPAGRLGLHDRARVRDPRERADRDVVAELLARL